MDLNPSEVIRSNNLFNSTILFDGTGEYTQIKERTKNSNGYYYYSNLAEIEPPLTDRIDYAMEEVKAEQETEILKKFTKTKLFQDIINM